MKKPRASGLTVVDGSIAHHVLAVSRARGHGPCNHVRSKSVDHRPVRPSVRALTDSRSPSSVNGATGCAVWHVNAAAIAESSDQPGGTRFYAPLRNWPE